MAMLKSFSCFVALWALASAQFGWDDYTPLDAYVEREDGEYHYEILATHIYNASTVYVVNMTSQKWQDDTFVDRPYWYHWMNIAIPDSENFTFPDVGALVIGGGSNDNTDSPPDRDDGTNVAIAAACVDLGIAVGVISQIPNEPLYFADEDDVRRSEDDIIAYTWRYFLEHGRSDPEVILRMPMTKAAKRGLDTIYNVAKEHDDTLEVTRFLPLGGSKRGWTTWSLAAVDRRVIAMAPLVFSMLKFNETLMKHYQTLGGAWSFAFEPYWAMDLTKELLEPYVNDLFWHEDMWFYRERFTMPLLQSTSSGDEFFLLQDSHQWWDDIPGPKWTYMLENAEHSMFPHYAKVYSTVTSWFKSLLLGERLPSVTWDQGENPDGSGYINFYTDMPPENVTAFRAVTLNNDTRRDYRLASGNESIGVGFHPVLWSENNIQLTEIVPGQHWQATSEPFLDEWVGMLIQGMWRGPRDQRMFFTSEVKILPDTFPVPPCTTADECYGQLV